MEKILVTGGAGYIGSHFAHYAAQKGLKVVILDDLRLGHKKAAGNLPLVQGDLCRQEVLDGVFGSPLAGPEPYTAVVHFAAYASVAESMADPEKYYRNNVLGGMELLSAMARHGVKKLVFSSTCAVYGEPERIPIQEDNPKNPINPYGASKLAFERMAMDMAAATGIRPVFLRYFNAAGADPGGALGEDHDPETHLIPIVLQAALGKRKQVNIFGTGYPTPDGTCVRDYIHVTDLAQAHFLALDYLAAGGAPDAFNLGNGAGHSVLEVVEAARRVTGRKIAAVYAPPRPGDPAILIGSSAKAMRALGWKPEHHSLETMIETAWRWMQNHPDGYEA